MRQRIAQGLGLSGLALFVSVVGVAPLRGQDPRDTCLAQLGKAPPERRLELLRCVLNPSAGPPRGSWAVGVQLLANTLIEDGRDSVATPWLRWAVRLSPDLQPDTVLLPPRVVAAFRAARDFVERTRVPGDTAAVTTWLWSTQEAGGSAGRLQVTAAVVGPMRVDVQGVGAIGVGCSIALNPGSYEITAAASGYDSVRVTREVVPGVTTVLEFHPRSALAQVVQKPGPAPTPPPGTIMPPQKKKGFPVVWVVGGGVAAGVLVAVLAHKSPSPPTTGSMTYTFTP